MTWFRVDDKFHDHPKVRKLRGDKLPAIGLWALAGSWAADNLSDGFVPVEVVRRFDPRERHARRLVAEGLWSRVDHENESGYLFHDWPSWQPSKSDVMAIRAGNARRAALHRDPELTAAVRERDANRCRYCAVLVNWKDRRSGLGGTYDHVLPAGNNNFDNIVVACRACNSSKGKRSPAEAGMVLLPAGTRPGDLRGSSSELETFQNESRSVLEDFKTPTRPFKNRSTYVGELPAVGMVGGSGGEALAPNPPPADVAKSAPRKRGAATKAKPEPRGTRIPDDFAVTPEMVAWARENTPGVDGRRETAKFKDFWEAKTGKDAAKKDWVAAWRYWMRNAEDRTPAKTTRPTADTKLAGWEAMKEQPTLWSPAITTGEQNHAIGHDTIVPE